MTWWRGRMVGFDLETTGPIPEDARTVTAAVVQVGGNEPTETRTWLADPGVPIPEEATAVHGVSTAQAQADGRPAPEVTAEVLEALAEPVELGLPIVIFNARFDLTVLDRECRRYGLDPLRPELLLVVDPFVIDQVLDRYRKSFPNGEYEGAISTRKLEGMCGVYDAVLDGAHDAAYDALAACRLAYRMGQRGQVRRRPRRPHEWAEFKTHEREWREGQLSLPALHAAQVRWALAERKRFAAYKRRQAEDLAMGNDEDAAREADEMAARIALEVGWPVLEPMPHEALETGPLA